MSRERSLSGVDATIRDALDVDVGPVEAEPSECGAKCDEPAVYRVPLPHGGDSPFCPYHLAWFLHEYPEIRAYLVEAPVREAPDPTKFASRRGRFVDLDMAPARIPDPEDDERELVRLALLHTGHVLYESENPDADGQVRYVAVDVALEIGGDDGDGFVECHRSEAGDVLRGIRDDVGFLDSEPGLELLLNGVGGPVLDEVSEGDVAPEGGGE